MKRFEHKNAETIEEATAALSKGGAKVIAGGTDLLGLMKFEVLPNYPDILVNIKTLPDMSYIKEEGGMLKLGALTKLKSIASNSSISSKYTALAQAADRTASPNLRVMGTIAGNICQDVRCWFFRANNNYFNCLRKNPNGLCYALTDDNRYHSIFGAMAGCVAVNPSDVAPALVALDANIVTTKKEIPVDDFFTVRAAPNGVGNTVLDDDEIVTEIQVPEFSGKSAFLKFSMRQSIDFPIVNCAAAVAEGSFRICLNAVAGVPRRATEAEEAMAGKSINESNAKAAADAAMSAATALTMNKYKIQIARTLVKRAILACA